VAFEPLTPERRTAMTRRHLLEAAAIVFARNGFHASTLEEVAATAGFIKGAVYSNFESKDDLFLALLDDRIERRSAVVTSSLCCTRGETRRCRQSSPASAQRSRAVAQKLI
jgi:AcrR family transcriptional regulator